MILTKFLTIMFATSYIFFFFNDTATTEIYTLSLHDALPISISIKWQISVNAPGSIFHSFYIHVARVKKDRKSTRLNSSHVRISYAVFCLKKKKGRHADRDRSRSGSVDRRASPEMLHIEIRLL